MVFTTDEEASAVCENLQSLMKLKGWDVTVKLADELPDGRSAQIEYDVHHKWAVIRLLRSHPRKELNHEQSLFHELTHLHLAPFDPLFEGNPLANLLLEQAICPIAAALYNLLDAVRNAAQFAAVEDGQDDSTETVV